VHSFAAHRLDNEKSFSSPTKPTPFPEGEHLRPVWGLLQLPVVRELWVSVSPLPRGRTTDRRSNAAACCSRHPARPTP
jgi:hypothetical protein